MKYFRRLIGIGTEWIDEIEICDCCHQVVKK
jgi:hypothetical protein